MSGPGNAPDCVVKTFVLKPLQTSATLANG